MSAQLPQRPYLWLLLCLPFLAKANPLDSLPTFVFQIPAERAAALYQGDSVRQHELSGLSLVDSFQHPSQAREWARGHYLYMEPRGEDLVFTLRSVNQHDIQLWNDGKKLRLHILDSLGHSRTDARVLLDQKVLDFDPATKLYQRKVGREGFLTVYLPGDTLFYDISAEQATSVCHRRLQRLGSRKVIYYAATPYRLVKNTYLYIKRGIGRGNWRWYRPFWKRWAFWNRPKPIKGYLATNQPKYQPGDTLRVAAYATHPKGRPWKEDLNLVIQYYDRTAGRQIRVLDQRLSPSEPGRYVWQMALADSLRLDQNYELILQHPHKGKVQPIRSRFRLEDYELEDFSFALNAQQEAYKSGEAVRLSARAEDSNGQAVFGTQVELWVLTQSIHDPQLDSLLIPDTLWQHRMDLEDRLDTEIVLPDSIFPSARIQATVQALFISPTGETEEKEVSITVNRPRQYLTLRLAQDSILGESLERGRSVPDTVQLSAITDGTGWSKTMTTPFAIPVDAYVQTYRLQNASTKNAVLRLYEEEARIDLDQHWERDSIVLRLTNPRRIPIQWQLYDAGGKVTSGSTSSPVWLYERAASSSRYWLKYQYVWAGEINTQEIELKPLKKMLRVDIRAPELVYPGETTPISVSVQGYDGKPAKGVNLTTAAYTARFQEGPPVVMSDITYERKRPPFVRYTYEQDAVFYRRLNALPLHRGWYDKMGLHRWLYYRIRYAEEPAYAERQKLSGVDTLQQMAQFAPFLIKNGQQQPIYLIYLDDRLIYYAGTTDATPYSFWASPGKHKLSLRARDYEFQTHIELDTAEHLTISYDVKRLAETGRIQVAGKFLSLGEKRLLRSSLLVLEKPYRGRPLYIWERTTDIHRTAVSQRPQVMGPFRENTELTFYDPQQETYSFTFEPGYRYHLSAQRDRLYDHPMFPDDKNVLPHQTDFPTPGQRALDFADIKPQPRIFRKEVAFTKWPVLPDPAVRGRITIDYAPEYFRGDTLILALYLEGSQTDAYYLLPKRTQNIDRLAAGVYRLHWVLNEKEVRTQVVEIKAHHTTFLRLNPLLLPPGEVPDSLPTRLWKTIETDPFSATSKTEVRDQEASQAQGMRLVKGYVKDENGEPLIGASILVQGTNTGTVTNLDGYYELLIPEGITELDINYTGFAKRTIRNPGQNNVTVLEEGLALLDEVIVTGYRVPLIEQDATTAVTLTSETISNLPTRKVSAIAGHAAGLSEEIHLRGSRSAQTMYYIDGVRISQEEARAAGYSIDERPLPPGTIRDNFHDYAYFQPHLRTDANGMAHYQVTFPDDITAWRHYAAAAGRSQRLGMAQSQSQSYLPLQAQLSLPRFLVVGDQSQARGRISNFTGDSLQLTTFFKNAAGAILQTSRVGVRTGFSETLDIEAGKSGEPLRLVYGLETADFTDGENRDIPIFRQGRERTLGYFFAFAKDTLVRTDFAAQRGPVVLELLDNGLSLLSREIEYVRDYPWGCTEQTASRLLALLAEKKMAEVRGEDHVHEDRIRAGIARLRKLQAERGGWSWFAGNQSSDWITLHVLQALAQAEAAGYEVTQPLTTGKRYLLSRVPAMTPQARLRVLLQFAEWKQLYDYDTFLPGLDTLPWKGYDQLALLRIQQIAGDTIELDTLWKYQQRTLLGGSYWGAESWHSWAPQREVIAQTLLAYRILRTARQTEEMQSIQQYLLAAQVGRPPALATRLGYNTLESAHILTTLLPDFLEESSVPTPRRVWLQGRGAPEQSIETFPARVEMTARTANELSIRHTGTGPIFAMMSQTYYATQPEAEDNGFTLRSRLYQGERATDQLVLGKPATLEVTVQNSAEGEYLLLQIPIPAGCSPVNRKAGKGEAHREYRRDRVAIFLERLPAGEHTFTIDLEPRFSGQYTLNPAQIELMYVPVINGANGTKSIRVLPDF